MVTNNIDLSQGFIDYVNAIKPYHTKILETTVEYVWTDELNVTIGERHKWDIDLTRPDVEAAYNNGWGEMWDPPVTSQLMTFRITDFVPGASGSFTVEGQKGIPVGMPFLLWTDNSSIPFSTVFIVDSSSIVGTETVINVQSGQAVPVLTQAPMYGLLITAIEVITVDVTTNSLILKGDVQTDVYDGVVLRSPEQLHSIVGVRSGTQVDRCYFEISGNHTGAFTHGCLFSVRGSSGNNGQYNLATAGAVYDHVNDITRAYVVQSVPSSSISGQLAISSMYLINASERDLKVVHVDSNMFAVRGDRINAFPNGGSSYVITSLLGQQTSPLTTVSGQQHYISSDPELYLTDPLYLTTGLTNVTIIYTSDNIGNQFNGGNVTFISQDQNTQVFIKCDIDQDMLLNSPYVGVLPNGEGWSHPEYSSLSQASDLHTDSYMHERLIIDILLE